MQTFLRPWCSQEMWKISESQYMRPEPTNTGLLLKVKQLATAITSHGKQIWHVNEYPTKHFLEIPDTLSQW